MENLTSELASEMVWLQPKIGKEYFELQTGAGVLETLSCNRGLFFEAVTVCSTFGEWVFKLEGLFPKIVVTPKDKHTEIVTDSHGWLKFASGNKFAWRVKGFWSKTYRFVDESEAALFLLYSGTPTKKSSNLVNTQAIVKMKPAGYHYQGEELSILLAMGWYLMLLDARIDDATLGFASAA